PRFFWPGLEEDVKKFTEDCTHCILSHPSRIPRPLGSEIHGQKPNEVLHFDFAWIYKIPILVIKDDLSGFVRLRACSAADGPNTAEKLIEWIGDFGLPLILVSDRGSHFKNSVMRSLTRGLHL